MRAIAPCCEHIVEGHGKDGCAGAGCSCTRNRYSAAQMARHVVARAERALHEPTRPPASLAPAKPPPSRSPQIVTRSGARFDLAAINEMLVAVYRCKVVLEVDVETLALKRAYLGESDGTPIP